MLPKLSDYRNLVIGKTCKWDGYKLSTKIKHWEHKGGYPVLGYSEKQWLYVTCPHCRYQWALHKLGIEEIKMTEAQLQQQSHAYVVGFAFSGNLNFVAMVTKEKPEWQKNLLNGIGGKIELGENPYDAMVREFREETSIIVDERWKLFATLTGDLQDDNCWTVFFFQTLIYRESGTSGYVLNKNYGLEDEIIQIYSREYLMQGGHDICISNVPMLLEAALLSIRFPKYKHLLIKEG